MKAVVLEIRDGEAAVLKKDGTIVKYTGPCEVGDTIEIGDAKGKMSAVKLRRYAVAAAAAAAVVIGTGSYSYVYAMPYAYVSMDVNPSVEFTLNRKEQVIAAEAVNDDAKPFIKDYESEMPKRADVNEAVGYATSWFYEEAYFDAEDTDGVLVNVTSDDAKECERLQSSVTETMDAVAEIHQKSVPLRMNSSTPKERDEARKNGISAGQFMEKKAPENTEVVRTGPVEQEETTDLPDAPANENRPEDGRPENTAIPEGTTPGEANGQHHSDSNESHEHKKPPTEGSGSSGQNQQNTNGGQQNGQSQGGQGQHITPTTPEGNTAPTGNTAPAESTTTDSVQTVPADNNGMSGNPNNPQSPQGSDQSGNQQPQENAGTDNGQQGQPPSNGGGTTGGDGGGTPGGDAGGAPGGAP